MPGSGGYVQPDPSVLDQLLTQPFNQITDKNPLNLKLRAWLIEPP